MQNVYLALAHFIVYFPSIAAPVLHLAKREQADINIIQPSRVMADLNALLEGLNEDLAAEYQAVIMYRTYASLVSGPYRQDLREFFEGEIPDELGHAAFLADKIVALGGTPTVEPKPVALTKDNKEMLENALQGEVETIERYTKRAQQAEEAGELGIKLQIENMIVDESTHRDDIRRMLVGWR
jgi:bacterioferritin